MERPERGFVPAVPTIQITHDAIAELVMYAASQADGVAEVGGNLGAGLNHLLGRATTWRGVRIDVDGREVDVSLHLIVRYGVRIPEVAQCVQEQVKEQVERATGLKVKSVDIHIQGLSFGEALQ